MRRTGLLQAPALLFAFLLACGNPPGSPPPEPEDHAQRDDAPAPAPQAEPEPAGERFESPTAGGPGTPLTPAQLEQGRLDEAWRASAKVPTGPPPAPVPETWDAIGPDVLDVRRIAVPLGGDVAGPSVLATQILLDRAWFSPGIVDGRWGKNLEKALAWFQQRQGLPATATLDAATLRMLVEASGSPATLVVDHVVGADEIAGPFVALPDDVQAKAKLKCLCYEHPSEELAERFHTSPELLAKLNPAVDLDRVAAGAKLRVPAVRGVEGPVQGAEVARILISAAGGWLQAVDAQDRIQFEAPVTVGSTFQPSPNGQMKVNGVHPDPWWHYQPKELDDVPDTEPEAHLPPGPNSPVGVVWIDLSEEGYGIHGTSDPASIGYTSSHGCVRLTNWDARDLAGRVKPGTSVTFVAPPKG